jgi:glycosyltransferase involved in cell wall biosynthesis
VYIGALQSTDVLITRVLAKLEPGGAQLSLLRVARALGRRGHRTRLLVGFATDAGVELARAHGIEPEVMGGAGDLQWRYDPAFADWLAPRLDDADVVHAHMLGGWLAAGHAIGAGVPLFASEHNDYAWPAEPQWRAMAEVVDRVDRFYAHSPGAHAGVVRAGMREERIVRGVSPVEGFGATERPGLPRPRIVYTGRLSTDKGPDVLIDAIARMAEPPPVLVLGAGVMEPALRAQIAADGLGDVVQLCGWQDDPARWVAGSAIQVCPSRDEAFSQAAVLAMALGVAVVGTRVDGFPDTLAAGRGVIVAPEDPVALASALEDLLAGRRHTDRIGARAWAQRFGTGKITTFYENDYLGQSLPLAAA